MSGTKTGDLAFITPAVIQWAIARASTTPEKLAKRLHAPRTAVAAWEQGKSLPTFSQAQKLAEALYIPFGYLFLSDPPLDRIPLTDFRAPLGKRITPSPELVDLVNDVLFKHEWYREFAIQEGATRLPFVGSFPVEGNARVGDHIRRTLRIDEVRQRSASWSDFFRGLIRNTEAAGILVMRSGVVAGNTRRRLSAKEFRGFAICDSIVPLIFINAKDWPRSQIFTLAHELAHIWTGSTGISNESLKDFEATERNPVEHFCNRTAAEVLVPSGDFLTIWDETKSIRENVDDAARHFRVSTLVVLRRARDLERISQKEYLKWYEREEHTFREGGEAQRKGGSFYNNVISRNSRTLTSVVVQGAISGKVLYRDAARLLNVNASAIQKVARHLVKSKEGG